jgi:hypothetical protein
MLKDSTGGTCNVVLKREAARKIVPSPPRVVIMSALLGRAPAELAVKIGKEKFLCICAATFGSKIRETFS